MIRFAVLGPGNISHRFIKGCNEYKNAEATAFASRTPAKVADYAASVHVEKVYKNKILFRTNFEIQLPILITSINKILENINLKDLRALNESILVNKGLDVVSVAKRLGHLPSTATNCYLDQIPEEDKKASEILENLF